ncbi:MAG: phosphoglycerate kinase [Bacteroidetes bacterium]|nr:phosphoglycerate kinase [Bacteroidota bacterium]
MKNIDSFSFKGKRAIVRVDFNVPLDTSFAVTDDTRIRGALPAIRKILSDGGSAILMSHLGRPKKGYEEKFSLIHLVAILKKLLGAPVSFSADCTGEKALQASKILKPGEVLLLENLRFHPEEEKGDETFAKELTSLADVYVNDAFGTAHRAHASTTIIAKFFPENKMFGYLMKSEVEALNRVLNNAQHPFTAVLGGAKVSDKIPVIERLMDKADNILIGGGMAYTFFKAMGDNIGTSKCEEDKLETARKLVALAKSKGVQLLLPVDSVIADIFSNEARTGLASSGTIPEGWMGLDIGNKAVSDFTEIIFASKTILWNGPMGVFEIPKFENGTRKIAEGIAEATSKGAYSLVGGGDSVAALNKFGLVEKVSYVSTGGGAMLEYVEGKELPGVKAILG